MLIANLRRVTLIPKNIAYQVRRLTDFDRLYGTDTSSPVRPAAYDVSSDYAEFGYEPTPVKYFRRVMNMARMDFRDAVFIDLGAGKGRSLLLASHFHFKRIVRVEFSPQLAAIAGQNVRAYRSFRQRCRSFDIQCCDAAQYEWPEESLLIYMYNPFSAELLKVILERLRASLDRFPRPVWLVYMNPVQREVLDQTSWLKLERLHQFESLIGRRPLWRAALYRGE